MPDKRMFIYFCLVLILPSIQSRDSPFGCWRCEVTIQSSKQTGIFLDDCQAQFDFTQHTHEKCDGKCWKSVDFIDTTRLTTNPFNRSISLFEQISSLSKLKSSRRCFSAHELVRAAEMGVNTSDGCRRVQRENKKTKEVCFCSDQTLCNQTWKFTNNLDVFFSSIFLVHLHRLVIHRE